MASVPVLYSTLYSVHCEISQIQRCNFELNYEYFFKNNDFSVGGEEVLVDMRSWDGPVQPKVVAPLAHQTEVESRRLAQLSSSMPTKTAKRRLRLQRRVLQCFGSASIIMRIRVQVPTFLHLEPVRVRVLEDMKKRKRKFKNNTYIMKSLIKTIFL